MSTSCDIAIIGAGHIGSAIARGLVASGHYPADRLLLTRRRANALEALGREGFVTSSDNQDAVRRSKLVVLAVEPHHIDGVLIEIAPEITPEHILVSVASGVSVDHLRDLLGKEVKIVRAMPNTAVAIRQSMTCLCAPEGSDEAVTTVRTVFDALGKTLVIDEELMTPATALCACGIAFFLRAIRAAGQGGVEIGFRAEDALVMAAQTAKGATGLLLESKSHPETEIDRVTTPRGCTIAGLNRMEHQGFSSALIRGIVESSKKASTLVDNE